MQCMELRGLGDDLYALQPLHSGHLAQVINRHRTSPALPVPIFLPQFHIDTTTAPSSFVLSARVLPSAQPGPTFSLNVHCRNKCFLATFWGTSMRAVRLLRLDGLRGVRGEGVAGGKLPASFSQDVHSAGYSIPPEVSTDQANVLKYLLSHSEGSEPLISAPAGPHTLDMRFPDEFADVGEGVAWQNSRRYVATTVVFAAAAESQLSRFAEADNLMGIITWSASLTDTQSQFIHAFDGNGKASSKPGEASPKEEKGLATSRATQASGLIEDSENGNPREPLILSAASTEDIDDTEYATSAAALPHGFPLSFDLKTQQFLLTAHKGYLIQVC